MIHNLSNDILYNICYNNNINTEEELLIEKLKLRNIMLVNKSLFKFIILKYEKLHLSNLDTNYKIMYEKYNKFYEVNIFEDFSVVDLDKFKNCLYLSLRSCFNISNVSQLKNIKFLDLSNCFELEDVSMLGNCKKLKLSNCHKITDVSNLGNVPYLDLSHCINIYDTLQLGNHTYLNLKGIYEYDVSNLCNVKILDISYNNNIYDISALKNVYNLNISNSLNIHLTTYMNNNIFTAENTHLVDDDIKYLKNVNTLILPKNNYINDLSPLVKTKNLDIRGCKNITVLPYNTLLDCIYVSHESYYYGNLISLDIHNLNIKKIDIDSFY